MTTKELTTKLSTLLGMSRWHVCQVCLEGEILQDYSDIEVVACNALDIVRGYKRIPFYIELFNVQKSYARLVL
jgi:hypothetical protein